MNRRERLRRCYFNEEVDRPAVYSRAGFPADDPSYDRLKAYLLTHTELKERWAGISLEATPWVPRYSPTAAERERRWGSADPAYPVEFHIEPYSSDFERRVTVLHTPAGDLECSFLAGLQGQPGIEERFLLKGSEDAEKYLSLPFPEFSGDVASFFAADAEVGEAGIVDVSLGANPAGFTAKLFGSTVFALLSVTDRDILHVLCQRQMKIMVERLKVLLSKKIGPFFSMASEEFVAPPLHGPADFYDFNVKYDKPIIDLIHDVGGRVHIHCHGSIKRVFRGFIDMGADVLHPFEALPMGDITPVEAKNQARDELCLEGNIQIHRLYEASPEEIREETEELIRVVFDDHKGLIVCPSASPYIPGQGEICLPRYRSMVETVLGWEGQR